MRQNQIAFAVYRNNLVGQEEANAEKNYAILVNTLFKDFNWIGTPQNFKVSSEVNEVYLLALDTGQDDELLLVEWLVRTCEDFLISKDKHLLILNDFVWLPEGFVESLSQTSEIITRGIDVLSLYYTEGTINPSVDSSFFEVPKCEISAVLITREATTRLVNSFRSKPIHNTGDLFKDSNVKIYSCPEQFSCRVYVYTNIWGAQDNYRRERKSPSIESHTIRDTNLDLVVPIKVDAFISHWFSTWDNVREIEAACKKVGYSTHVLNTTEIETAGWVNHVPISFFRQVERACEMFDETNEFLFFVCADVKGGNWVEYFKHVERYLSLAETGTLSPTVTYTNFRRSSFPKANFVREDHLTTFPYNDILCLYIKKSIVMKMQDFFKFFNSNPKSFHPQIGFGIVDVMNEITDNLDLVHLKDNCYSFMHPFSTSYSTSIGQDELTPIFNIASEFFDYPFNSIFWNFDKITASFSHPQIYPDGDSKIY